MSSAAPARSSSSGVLLALGSALAFSSLAVWGKLAGEVGLATYTLLPWRFGLVAAALFLVAGGRAPLGVRARMLGSGVLYSLATTCYFLALARITAGATGLLLYLSPAFVVLFAALLGRKPARAQLAGVALAVVGLAVVIGLPGAGDRDATGLAFGVLTGALYGAYLLYAERFLKDTPPLQTTAHMSLVAAVVFALLGAGTGTLDVPRGLDAWGVVLATAIFPTLLAVPTLYAAITRLGAARASVLATTEPLWTVLLAALVLHEPLRPAVLIGGGLILVGALVAQRAPVHPGEHV
ncbi:DMT family transporter [Deinococcus maricopensis]|uniref:DMT family transporter n=1 Tax=Deinococcus maricopensis TaxID=309887 RepID=UPI0005C1C10B|nr:DMT family transporter [Deinococcus maricopensis]